MTPKNSQTGYEVHNLTVADGGKLAIERQSNSRFWYARISKPGEKGYVRKSTKEEDYFRASQVSVRLYMEHNIKKAPPFKEVSAQWLEKLQSDCDNNLVGKNSYKDYSPKVDRFFMPFFGDKKINEIGDSDLKEYWEWRWTYWTSGPGSQLSHISYERNGSKLKRKAPSDHPSETTLKKEVIPLRAIFEFAMHKGFITKSSMPNISFSGIIRKAATGKAHPAFTQNQLKLLEETARKRIEDSKSENELLYRIQLYYYIIFVSRTGIRPGTETSRLKWTNIITIENRKNKAVKAARVLSSKHKKVGQAPHRDVVLDDYTIENLTAWRSISPYKQGENYIFCHLDGKPIQNFDSGFRNLLKAAEIRVSDDGRPYTLYSLRATYATRLLVDGVDAWVVAKQMGHSNPEMLLRHYGQDRAIDHASVLRDEKDPILAMFKARREKKAKQKK